MADGQGTYTDGTYTGSASGYRGTTTVEVTVSSGIISEINVVSTEDDAEFFNRAKSSVINDIIANQATENISTVSGATFSSNGIIEAVADALNVTFENPNNSLSNQGAGHHGHGGF